MMIFILNYKVEEIVITNTTTIIGSNKIDYVKTLNKKSYFVFYFIDGLFLIEYSDNIFNSFDICEQYIFRDNKKELKINYHIPTCLLKRIAF